MAFIYKVFIVLEGKRDKFNAKNNAKDNAKNRKLKTPFFSETSEKNETMAILMDSLRKKKLKPH